MTVETKITVYELNGRDCGAAVLAVQSHWNGTDRIVLAFPGGEQTITVVADDLQRAIANAINRR